MPIYTEKTHNTIPVPNTPSVLPNFICDYSPGSDKYERLREFSKIVYKNRSNSFVHKNLYNTFIKNILTFTNPIDDSTIIVDSLSLLPILKTFPLAVSDLLSIPNYFACEAATIFSYYYSARNLALDTRWKENNTGFFYEVFDVPPADNIYTRIDSLSNQVTKEINFPTKSYIFVLLRSKLTEFGFKPNAIITSVEQKVKINSLLDPFNFIGVLKTSFTTENFNTNPSSLLKDEDTKMGANSTEFVGENTSNDDSFDRQFFPLFHSLVNKDYPSLSDSFTLNTDNMDSTFFNEKIEEVFAQVLSRDATISNSLKETTGFKTRVTYYIAEKFYSEFSKIIENYIQDEVKCFFSAILNTSEIPKPIILATGDGSDTSGLLGIYNFGALLFNYSFLYKNLGKVLPVNEQSFTQPKKALVHLKIIGLDSSSYSTVSFTYKNRVGSIETFKLIAKKTSPDLRLDPPYPGDIIYSEGIPIAKFYAADQNIEFLSDSSFDFKIKMESASLISGGYDEVQLIVCIVNKINPNQPAPELIHVEKAYNDDKFELEKNEINRLLANNPAFMTTLAKEFRAGRPLVPNLTGQFVGKLKTPQIPFESKVIPDPDYVPDSSAFKAEVGSNLIESYFSDVRYSFGKIEIINSGSGNVIYIYIDSWVSPLRSRLDDRFTKNSTAPDYDVVSGTIDYDWDYRNDTIPPPLHIGDASLPSGPPPSITLLNSFTLSGYQLNLPGGYNIKSYNQALACLRSLGTLEGILYRVYDTWIALYPTEIATAKSVLKGILTSTSTVVLSNDINGTVRGNGGLYQLLTPITYADYKNLKWYRLYKTYSDSPYDPTEYEYFKYRHELD